MGVTEYLIYCDVIKVIHAARDVEVRDSVPRLYELWRRRPYAGIVSIDETDCLFLELPYDTRVFNWHDVVDPRIVFLVNIACVAIHHLAQQADDCPHVMFCGEGKCVSARYRAVEDVVILGARYDFVQRVGYAIDSEIGQLRQPWELFGRLSRISRDGR